MKINEITNPFKKKLSLPFGDTSALQEKVTEVLDTVIKFYKEGGPRSHSIVEFSPDINEAIKQYTLAYIAKTYDIKDDREIQMLKQILAKISIHYMEFKLNNIIP